MPTGNTWVRNHRSPICRHRGWCPPFGAPPVTPRSRWLASSGEGSFTDLTTKSLPDPGTTKDWLQGHALEVGDLDGDGDLDLVLTTELWDFLEKGKRPTRLLRTD